MSGRSYLCDSWFSQTLRHKNDLYIWAYFKIVFSLRRDIFHGFLPIYTFFNAWKASFWQFCRELPYLQLEKKTRKKNKLRL